MDQDKQVTPTLYKDGKPEKLRVNFSNGNDIAAQDILLDDYQSIERSPPSFVKIATASREKHYDLTRVLTKQRRIHQRRLQTYTDCILIGEDYVIKDDMVFSRYFAAGDHRVQKAAERYSAGNSERIKLLATDNRGQYLVDRAHLEGAIDLDGRVMLATPDEPMNYGMWLFLVVPAVYEFITSRKRYDKLMCYCPSPWQKALLATLGIGKDDVIEQDLSKYYRCGSLTMHRASNRDLYVRESYAEAFDWAATKFSCSVPNCNKVFLSRLSRTNNGAYRGLLNEGELIDGLAGRGFAIVEPEKLSFAEQMGLFRSADYVVGLGGAGMFNTVFCRENTKLVDIESGLAFLDVHCNIFASRKLDYGIVLGDEDPEDPRPTQKSWRLDVGSALESIDSFAC